MRLIDHSDADLALLQIHLGGDRNFCYLVGDRASGAAAAIDPAFQPQRMADIAAEHDLAIRHILVTHEHADHCAGVAALAAATGAAVHAGAQARLDAATGLVDGQTLPLGNLTIEAVATPGHSPGHTCYLVADRLFTGDILFCGKVGGTGAHFPGSSAAAEWESLQRLLRLPDATAVFPGHDYHGGDGERTWSTIGHERATNPFLICRDFEAFCYLKDNWAAYKQAHGIR